MLIKDKILCRKRCTYQIGFSPANLLLCQSYYSVQLGGLKRRSGGRSPLLTRARVVFIDNLVASVGFLPL